MYKGELSASRCRAKWTRAPTPKRLEQPLDQRVIVTAKVVVEHADHGRRARHLAEDDEASLAVVHNDAVASCTSSSSMAPWPSSSIASRYVSLRSLAAARTCNFSARRARTQQRHAHGVFAQKVDRVAPQPLRQALVSRRSPSGRRSAARRSGAAGVHSLGCQELLPARSGAPL